MNKRINRKVFEDTIENMFGKDQYRITGLRGTQISKELRKNHVPNMVRVLDNVEYPLGEIEYLVFQIPNEVDRNDLRRIHHWMGITIEKRDQHTEIACHYPHVFSIGVIPLLELGYIKVTWKQYSNDPGEYPFYVNPKGWQWAYNVMSMLKEGIWKLSHRRHEIGQRESK